MAGALFLFGIGCSGGKYIEHPNGVTSGDYTFQISAGNLDREYVVHVPTLYSEDRQAAVVIMLHGGGGTAHGAMTKTGWDKMADHAGFLAVFPEGTRPHPEHPPVFSSNPQTWNDGSGRENIGAVRRNVDDVGFLAALLDDLTARFNIDQDRIYAVGFSNGAAMVFRAGRELSHALVAIACVASTDWLEEPPAGSPVSMLYMTGTSDPLNPIDGGEIFIGPRNFGVKPPVQQTIRKWVQMLNCSSDPEEIHNSDGVTGIAYSPCVEGAEVVFYSIEGMGHWWPGWIPPDSYPPWLRNLFGEPSENIQGTETIWAFFQTHQRNKRQTKTDEH